MNLTPPPSRNCHAVRWHRTAESKRRVAMVSKLHVYNFGQSWQVFYNIVAIYFEVHFLPAHIIQLYSAANLSCES